MNNEVFFSFDFCTTLKKNPGSQCYVGCTKQKSNNKSRGTSHSLNDVNNKWQSTEQDKRLVSSFFSSF